MTLLDWRQHHLWVRRNRQFLPSQRVSEVISAEIVALPERRFPRAAAQTRILSLARIRLDLPKSVRPFKGIFCNDVSELCGIGGEPEALVRLEAFDRLHQMIFTSSGRMSPSSSTVI